ncbi:tyrosine-protein phosphatase [Leucobacter sp. wl10]|uniref:tyrosine-protein phosphatase n=1 Tax=Leucobacter sp. wl10 TaxID=2304677 RepID=UPI000E5A584E|nr:tyrosine-protein phosphatase [Leucobacter sp. wl10]RGE17632.1 tyrosine-protein phosphatase [Leucobacter sp. wl10]
MTDRLIAIEGTYNFRDLGGYRADGGTIRSGALFRSDALHRIGDRGRAQLSDLGVARVVDLRDERERAHLPDMLPEGASLVASPIFPDAAVHVVEKLDIVALTELIYLQHSDTLSASVALLADDDDPAGSVATVFHCTAGKDRTGAVAALTLLSAGVDRDDVVGDYAASAEHLRDVWLVQRLEDMRRAGVEITPMLEGLVGSTPIAAIEGALSGIERRYGSVRDYLLANGLSEAQLERLHDRLVVSG